MISSSAHETGSKQELLEEQVFQVAEQYGLEIKEELDEIGVRYLGKYVNARTSWEGSDLRIDFDSQNFFKKTEAEQKRIMLHELIHVKQFNNSLSDWTREQFDISDGFAEKLENTIWEDVRSIEGETELILSNLFPEMNSSYPYELESKQRELEGANIDVDSELTREVEEMTEEIVARYREVEESWSEENIYIEKGSINGFEYEVAVTGEEIGNAEEKVSDYIEEKVEEYLTSAEETYSSAEYLEGYDSIAEVSEAITPKMTSPTDGLDGENYAAL